MLQLEIEQRKVERENLERQLRETSLEWAEEVDEVESQIKVGCVSSASLIVLTCRRYRRQSKRWRNESG